MKILLLTSLLLSAVAARGAMTIRGAISVSGAVQLSGDALTVPSKAINFSPANGATRVAKNPTATWQNGGGALTYTVYGDTFSPPTTARATSQAGTSLALTVDYGTTYYWKVNPINNSGTTTGDVNSFTTVSTVPVDGYSSLNVGGSDGDQLTAAKMATGTELSLGTWAPTTVPAGSFITGLKYQIVSSGNTDWTAIGAANNNVGTQFTATGVGSGTGTAFVNRMFVSTSPTALYSPVKNGSTVWLGNTSTTAAKFGMDSQSCEMTLTLTSSVPVVSVSFWLTFGPLAASNEEVLDFGQVQTATGKFVTPQMSNAGLLHVHNSYSGGTQTGPNIAGTTAGNAYWITLYCSQRGTTKNAGSLVTGAVYCIGTPGNTDWTAVGAANNNAGTFFIATGAGSGTGVANSADMLKIYDATGNLLGTSGADSSTDPTGNYTKIRIGRTDSHNASNQPPSTSYAVISQLVINTSGVYPLGP